MSDLLLIPDVELTVGRYLRDHPDLTVLGVRVGGRIPSSLTMPWVRLTQLAGTDLGGHEHLIEFLLQHDCYAGDAAMTSHVGQKEAWLVARTVRAALKATQGRVLDAMAVTGVDFIGMSRIPDVGFEPARERVVLDAHVYAHRCRPDS